MLTPQKVYFAGQGGPLHAIVRCAQASTGSHTLYLFEADGLTLVQRWPTIDFPDTGSVRHALPTPAHANGGRLLLLNARVGLVPPDGAYAVYLDVHQDGRSLGGAHDVGAEDPDALTHRTTMLVALSADPPPKLAADVLDALATDGHAAGTRA